VVVGNLARRRRCASFARAVSRYLLPAAGAGIAVALACGTAHASASAITPDPATASGATTADTLSWTLTTDMPPPPTVCTLSAGGTTVEGPLDCTSGTVSFNPVADAGVYVAQAYDGDVTGFDPATATPVATSPDVTVIPAAPTPTFSAADTVDEHHPAWTFTVPAGGSATCTVTDSSSPPALSTGPCSSPFIADLAAQPDGSYGVAVSVTQNGLTSSDATTTYQLSTPPPPPGAPAAPSVSADQPTGTTLTPSFTVSGVAPGDTLDCTATGPGTVTVDTCDAHPSLTIAADAPDGTYTLSVYASGYVW
jgi:hypothetical protein